MRCKKSITLDKEAWMSPTHETRPPTLATEQPLATSAGMCLYATLISELLEEFIIK
jgi:hypothetical protein